MRKLIGKGLGFGFETHKKRGREGFFFYYSKKRETDLDFSFFSMEKIIYSQSGLGLPLFY